jgi:alkylation response protein AidB-like acyl-CoA dehydrogenase
MITREEINALNCESPGFDETFFSLNAVGKKPVDIKKETRKIIALARKFNKEVVRPHALLLDLKVQEDPNHIPWDFVEKANAWGFYTLWIPKLFGGKGTNQPSISIFLEEIASECLGMANLIAVHYLSFAAAVSTWNFKLLSRLCQDAANGERTGKPCLMSLAQTEPGAGTDVENTDLMNKGTVSCHARKVIGGYVVNGTKVFISNGHLSHWHIVVAYEDLNRPSETMMMLAVETGAEGFSLGRIEKKMGQKACPASEMMFNNCFIPDENVFYNADQWKIYKRSPAQTNMQIMDYYLSGSRASVGALGVGVARSAFNAALDYAGKTTLNGRRMINLEWVQSMLAEMYSNIVLGRLAYIEANYASSLYGMSKWITQKHIYYVMKYTPDYIYKKFLQPLLVKKSVTTLSRRLYFDLQKDAEINRTSGLSSLAKSVGTDLGLKNCNMALELMGQSGLRHDHRVEKCLRDAKLLQIYEGTNQLNRLNLFKCMIAKDLEQVDVFDE